ncbi:MAG: purine/pyrimidine permease [Bifidobacterium tibiigranuli]|nr:purine/pyrimidine permease [Bifidobacterium tibiigranuli]MCI1796981.1 purine/pyrimidine permease [Bifidobacterium tibiigranuli]
MAHTESNVTLVVGFNDKLSPGRTLLFAVQHIFGLTGIFLFPVVIGTSLKLQTTQTSMILQACFLMTGIVTVLQSSRILKLPIVQGPTAAFMVAIISAGAAHGLGVAFGSLAVAAIIFMILTVPLKHFGLFGRLNKLASAPIVAGSLFVIIGAQLASIAAGGWFGTAGTSSYGLPSFGITIFTMLVVLIVMLLVRNSIAQRGAVLIGIVAGVILAAATGMWNLPDFSQTAIIGLPHILPFGFGIDPGTVLLMLLACLQGGSESMGMYELVASWGDETFDTNRVNRGLFTEFFGTMIGALFGGIGTTSYPENAGIVRASRVGSRYVTMTTGFICIILAFIPSASFFLASLPGPALYGACTLLYGFIMVSGIQMLASVKWDQPNLAVAGTAILVSLGAQVIPAAISSRLPSMFSGILTNPMMIGIVLLMVLHAVVNYGLRPITERRKEKDEVAEPVAANSTEQKVDVA